MNYKERLREYIENDVIYTEYKNGKMDMSDFDKFCIEHCKDIESLLNEVQDYKDVIDKASSYIQEVDCCTWDNSSHEDLLAILKEVE